MDYKELNIRHRNFFEQTVKVEHRIEWEDNDLIKILLGEMPHFYASNLIADEMNIVAVSKRLGHSDVAMTLQIYTHLLQKMMLN